MIRSIIVIIFLFLLSTHLHARNNHYTQEDLLNSVNSFAKRLPMQIDAITTITATTLLNNRTIQYRYAVDKNKTIELAASGVNISVDQFRKVAVEKYGSIENMLKIWAKTSLVHQMEITNCSTPDTREWLADGVRLVHTIYLDDGLFLHEESIGIEKCN